MSSMALSSCQTSCLYDSSACYIYLFFFSFHIFWPKVSRNIRDAICLESNVLHHTLYVAQSD